MASKKYLFLTGLLSLLVMSNAFGQSSTTSSMTGGSYDYMDTAFIPASHQAQQRSFLNNQSIYPAKPRDMWQLGINGGYYAIFSDIPSQPGYGFGVSLRKSLGYTFSLRGGFDYGQAKGIDYRLSTWPGANSDPAYNGYPSMAGQSFVRNYKSTDYAFSLDLLASLNNIMFHSAQNKVDFYVLGGYTLLGYSTKTDIFSSGQTPYNFSGVNFGDKRKNIIKAVKNVLQGNYVAAPNERRTANNNNANKNFWLRHSLDAGVGAQIKISPRFDLGLEQKFTMPFDPWITGYGSLASGGLAKNPVISYSSVSLNFNLGNAAKRVEPLWWMNPLNYAYSELNAPRHMKIPTPVLPDADGDGVTDQFDKCPNTPAGAPVDVHGCPLDTDGDGVPDYKDKQLITPTYCQPVDADGVGKCPCPDSTCFAGYIKNVCNLGYLPSIMFKGHSVKIGTDQEAMLDNVANQMRQNPDCKVVVTGHAQASKASEQLAWDRVNSVITYLTEKEGISGDRFIFQYSGVPGDINSVDLRTATDADNGPNMTPPPHPNLRRSK